VRILILEPSPNFGGGCESVALELCKELSKRGHELFLVYSTEGTMLPVYEKFAIQLWKTSLHCFGWRTPLKSFDCIRRLGHFVKFHDIDVVLSTDWRYLRTLALVKVFYKVEIVYHLGLPKYTADWSVKWAIDKIFSGIAPSQRTAESWEKIGWHRKKLFVVPNWIDFTRFKPPENKAIIRKKLGLSENDKIVLHVGRIVPEKGIEVLIRAFSKVVKETSNVVLVLVGGVDNQYTLTLKKYYKELGLSRKQVIEVGITKEPEKYFAAADIAVVPSIWDEPFGLTLLEAMACGTFSLVSSFGELPYIIGGENEDLVLPAGEIDALANSLIYWLSRPDKSQERGYKLYERAVKKFGHSDKVDVYEKIMLDASYQRQYAGRSGLNGKDSNPDWRTPLHGSPSAKRG